MTTIPGIKLLHKIVSRECRKRDEDEWIGEVNDEIRRQLVHLNRSWPLDSKVKFHIAIIVEKVKDHWKGGN